MISDAQALSALLRQEFALFLRFAFQEIGGEGHYGHNWHIDAIIHQLERIRSGDNRRLIVTMPPRHLKSVTISTAWVAWMLGKNPGLRFICVSYGQDLADKHARDCLRIMQSGWYRAAFPNLVLTRRTISDFETSAGGGRLSTSLGGVLTGRGANIIVIDDPVKADEAMQEHSREAAKEWLHNSLMSRLDSQEHSSIILVMQRLHQNDLAGELIERGGWDELRLSAVATHDERVPLGLERSYQLRTGCALHPARQSLAVLAEIRARNSIVFAAQYQQEPVPAEGNMIRAEWLKSYESMPEGGQIVQSWDTASKVGVLNDWSVCITARMIKNSVYVLDVWRRKVEFPDLKRAAIGLARQHSATVMLIEDQASGTQLCQTLVNESPRGVPQPIRRKPEADKKTRLAGVSAMIEARQLHLPGQASWLGEFTQELLAFPSGRHDDQVDALSQLLTWVGLQQRWDDLQPLGCGPIIFVGGEAWPGSGGVGYGWSDGIGHV